MSKSTRQKWMGRIAPHLRAYELFGCEVVTGDQHTQEGGTLGGFIVYPRGRAHRVAHKDLCWTHVDWRRGHWIIRMSDWPGHTGETRTSEMDDVIDMVDRWVRQMLRKN